MCEWDPSLFDQLYEAFVRRSRVEELNARKIAMVAALNANSAFYKTKDGPQILEQAVERLASQIDDLVGEVYGAPTQDAIDEMIVKTDPFFTAMKDIEVDQLVPQEEAPADDG